MTFIVSDDGQYPVNDVTEQFEDEAVANLMLVKDRIEVIIAAKAHDEIRAIDQQIAELTIRQDKLIELYGEPKKVKKTRKTSASVVKFRHPETGKTWSGRGKTPQWMFEARQVYSDNQLLAALAA